MLPVVPSLVVFATQASAPRYFTNAENVRRIAAGKGHVAFATSGGVKVFERASQKWRVYTQNDGLPTHNIHDVVFDKTKPDTLWILCGAWGDWANEQPEPDLRIVTLDLASGKVESVAPPIAAPRTARMGYKYFLDYRLSVSDSWAFVFTDKGAALAWERNTKKWTRQINIEATPPRVSAYPGHAASLQLVGSSGSTLAFFIRTKLQYINQSQVVPGANGQPPTVINTMIPMGDGLPPHILLFDRQTGRSTRHPLSQDLMGQSRFTPSSDGKTTTFISGARPGRLIPDTRTGTFLIESLTSEAQYVPGQEANQVSYQKITHRIAPNLKEPVALGSEKITREQARAIQQNQRVDLVYFTDFLLDGNTLWVTGYNDMNYPQSAGVARLDLTTGKWERFKPNDNGLKANFTAIRRDGKDIFAWQNYSYPRVFSAKADDFVTQFATNPNELSFPSSFPTSSYPDPRAKPTDENDRFAWAPLRVLGTSPDQALVLGPADAGRFYERQGNEFKTFPVKYDTLFFYEPTTKKLTKLEMRGLEGLVPRAAGFTDTALFFLTEERAPGERRGAPVVIRWDRNTGAVKRYPESLFREVSVAAQRAAGVRQQADLKRRQKQSEEQRKRFPQLPPQPIELRPPLEFLAPLAGTFLRAAGTTWLQLDQHLFRYDSSQDTWSAEGLADSLSPEGETALWKQTGPEWWRFEDFEARRLRGTISRWSAATGWQRLELGESTRQAGNGVLFHDGALWLTGVGALRLPAQTWKFEKP